MLRTGHAPVVCRAPLPAASYRKRRGVDTAPALAAVPLASSLLGFRRTPRRREPRVGVPACARSSDERAAEASQPGKLRAVPGGALFQPPTPLQPRRRGTALAATAGEAGENEGECTAAFFNRKEELQSLDALLGEPPTGVLVMTGPPSCGKTALLKQLVAGVTKPPRPTVIDCRAGDYMSPAAFSANLVKCMQNDWQLGGGRLLALVPMNLKLKVKWARLLSFGFGLDGTFELDLLRTELQKDPQTALQTITNAYLKLVKDAKKKRKAGDPWPVIIIDEANRLMVWKDKESLEQLLAFFVYLTKQEQLAHVILATSDTFLTQWLDLGPIKGPFRTPCVLGNLSREEARTYFFDYVLPFRKHAPSSASEMWERVYDVCGGNPGLLQLCASKAAALRSWELGCNAIVQTAMTDISHGLFPKVSWKDAAWSAEDFHTVLRSIVSSPHAAVLVLQMYAELGDDGAAKLASMNAKNLLLRRAYDPLARDIDAAAFGEDREDVYTLPSAAHVLAARRKLKL